MVYLSEQWHINGILWKYRRFILCFNGFAGEILFKTKVKHETCKTDQKKAKTDWERTIKGGLKAAGGVVLTAVGVGFAIGTGGLGGFLVGGAMALFGAADLTEGGQDVYYGAKGSNKKSANLIKDKVFRGNETAYYAVEGVLNLGMLGYGVLGSLNKPNTLKLKPVEHKTNLTDRANSVSKLEGASGGETPKTSFRDMMTPEEAARYDKWWDSRTWSMGEDGAVINGRRYTAHSLERMAPDTPEIRAKLEARASDKAETKGFKPGTKDYNDYIKKYVQPRNVPPTVVEDAIKNVKPVKGTNPGTWVHETRDVKVIVNYDGDVITVIPK